MNKKPYFAEATKGILHSLRNAGDAEWRRGIWAALDSIGLFAGRGYFKWTFL